MSGLIDTLTPDSESSGDAWFHWLAAVFFTVQIPPSLIAYFAYRGIFDELWKPYLVFLSLWALVSTHLAGYLAAQAKAEARKAQT